MFQESCLIKSCDEIASKTFLLKFVSSQIAQSSKPGQFVNILTSENGNGPLLRRPFSVSRIDGDTIEILFHAIGPGTVLLSKKRGGDEIDVIGPLGQSFKLDADYETAILIGGGIGVAPFPFLTEELLKLGKRIKTFIGFRNSLLVYSSFLQNVYIATDDGSDGFKGNVIQLLDKHFSETKYGSAKIFGCGPTVMLKALTQIAKKENICCEISLEGQMACGVGICQGCPVERNGDERKYALVCKDGPVFLANEIIL